MNSENRRGMKRLADFSQESSMHGVRYIDMKQIGLVRRVCWLLLICAAFGYFSYAAYRFFDVYSKSGLSTKITMQKADQLALPTITICNQNLWKLEAMNEVAKQMGSKVIFDVMKDLYKIYGDEPLPISKYNWSAPQYAPIAAMGVKETVNFLRGAAHTLNETFFACHLLGLEVNCKSILQQVITSGGFCYQFNSDGKVKTNAAGRTGGVRFGMVTHVEQYTTGPTSYSEGFSLTFHNSHEVPLVTELGVGVSPGTHSSIRLHKSEIRRYPPPADDGKSDCFDTTTLPNPLLYYNKYSYAACKVECLTAYVINKCGCHDGSQPPLYDTGLCLLPQMLYCSKPAMRQFMSDPEGLQACNCKEPCINSEYTPKISTYKFPSTNYVREQNMKPAEVLWLKENALVVDIFYGKMSYQIIEESLTFNMFDMIANVGGTLGLCIGASILTLCEFLEFLLLAVIGCFRKDKRRQSNGDIKPVDNELTQNRIIVVQQPLNITRQAETQI